MKPHVHVVRQCAHNSVNDEINALVMCEYYIIFIVLFYFITCQPTTYIVIEDKTNPKGGKLISCLLFPHLPHPPSPPPKKIRLKLRCTIKSISNFLHVPSHISYKIRTKLTSTLCVLNINK